MFHQQVSSTAQGRLQARQGKSSRYMQSQRFIPPTHPAYVVTSHFEAPHILALQEELDRHYIATAMQTSNKKFSRVSDMPEDRFFIINDDTAGQKTLQGDFLTLNSRVVGYPIAHSLPQVVQAFKEYIGLGHYETSEQYYQNNENAVSQEEKRQTTVLVKAGGEQQLSQMHSGLSTLVANLNKNDAITSVVSACNMSKIQLREVSSLKVQSKLSKGRLYIYDNRKDCTEFKEFIVQLKTRFSSVSSIQFIERIDEYNNQVRLTREADNIVLMSHYSFISLSKYFIKYRSFALFLTQNEKLDLFCHKYVALATSRKDKIIAFVQLFMQNRSKIMENDVPAVKAASQVARQRGENDGSVDSAAPIMANKASPPVNPAQKQIKKQHNQKISDVKPNQKSKQIALNSVSPLSPKSKPQIQLVRVTDLDKKTVDQFKNKLKQQPIQMNQKGKNGVAPSTAQSNHPTLLPQQQKQQIARQINAKPDQKGNFKANLSLASPQKQQKLYQIPQFKENGIVVVAPQKHLSKLIMQGDVEDISFENRSHQTKKSKIKRLKSSKKVPQGDKSQISAQLSDVKPSELQEIQLHKSPTRKRPTTSVTGHLRMGSDDHNSRSKQRMRPKHGRNHSDADKFCIEVPEVRVCVPAPRDNSEPNDYYSILPQIEERSSNHPHKDSGSPSNGKVSIRLFPSIKQRSSSKELSHQKPDFKQNLGQNIMNTIRKPKQKKGHNMAQKLGGSSEENEEMAIVRKPKARFTVKHEPNEEQKQQIQLYEEEFEQLGLMTHPVPKDEVELLKLRNKVNADEYNIAGPVKKNRKVMKANVIPPSFQTVTSSEIYSNADYENDFDTPVISNISSIKPKIAPKLPEGQSKGKRFTFGIEDSPDYHKRRQKKKTTINLETPNYIASNNNNNLDYDKQTPKYIDFPVKTIEVPSEEGPKSLLRPNKSKSMQQVHRVFNKYKIKPAEQINSELAKGILPEGYYNKQNDDLLPRKSDISRRPSDIRVGKIYSNLKCKAANSRMEEPLSRPSSLTPSRTLNKGIEDLIDLSKYDKIIENGVTVYRSKYPIQVSQYTPSQLTVTPSVSTLNNYPIHRQFASNSPSPAPQSKENASNLPLKGVINPKKHSSTLQDPYLLENAKQNRRPTQKQQNMLRRSKSGATPLVKYIPRDSQKQQSPKLAIKDHKKVAPNIKDCPTDSIGIQCESDPFNSLVNANTQQLMTRISNKKPPPSKLTSSKVARYDPSRPATKSTAHPIQDLLASKLSNSGQNSPTLILDMESPLMNSNDDDASSVASSHQSHLNNSNESTQKLILYLIDKSQPSLLFEQLNSVRSRKDSLITFKHEKQLAQQLPQTINIYDIVYVIPVEGSKGIDGLVKGYKNCYVVQIADGKTKIKGNRVTLASLKYLTDVTDLLLKQAPKKAVKSKGKGKAYLSPSKLQEKDYCFSPNATYFVPNCCHTRTCCSPMPRQVCYHSDIPSK